MIVTLTPNPSVDRTYELTQFDRGAVMRSSATRVDPGGKGINVARALIANGMAARAVVPLGGPEGEQLRHGVERLDPDLEVIAVPVAEATRTNITLVEPDGTTTKINAPGPRLSTDEATALTKAAVEAMGDAAWVAGSGSLPPGAPEQLYAELIEEAHAAGARVAIDSSGPPLAASLRAHPDLIKPNADELAGLVGWPIRTLGDVLSAVKTLRRKGARTVVISLGADGAVLVEDSTAWHATVQRIVPRSSVGAGDSLVAGLLAEGGEGPEALRRGVAYGTAAAQLPGTQLPGPDDLDLDAVRIQDVEPTRPLLEPGGIH